MVDICKNFLAHSTGRSKLQFSQTNELCIEMDIFLEAQMVDCSGEALGLIVNIYGSVTVIVKMKIYLSLGLF